MWPFTPKKADPPVTIAVVDPHRLFREGISQLLTHYNYQVKMTCADGKEFITQLDSENLPDVLFIDVGETKASKLHSTVKAIYPSVKIVVMAIEKRELEGLEKEEAIQAHISKTADPSAFKMAVKAVMKGKAFYERDVDLVLYEEPDPLMIERMRNQGWY